MLRIFTTPGPLRITLRSLCLAASVAGFSLSFCPCFGAIRFELPEIDLVSDGAAPVTGTLDVVIRADPDDIPQMVAGFNVHFGVDSTFVQFGLPVVPASNPLLSGGSGLLVFSPNSQTIRAAHDVFPGSAPLGDLLSLIQVPYEVAAGEFGIFSLTLLSQNELVDSNAAILPLNTESTGFVHVHPAPTLDGDFDFDEDVDGGDFLTWQRGLGTTFGANDLAKWAANFSEGSGTLLSESTTVPEPSIFVLLGGLVITMLAFRNPTKEGLTWALKRTC